MNRFLLIAALVVTVPGVAHAQAAGDPAKGKSLFLQCAACHSSAAGAPHKVGPNLAGIYGAHAGTRPGYAYSPAMRAVKFDWDDANLLQFLQKPSGLVPGTKMIFAGVPDPVKRAHLLAYIKSIK